MPTQPLDQKWTQPRVALLDDRPGEVEPLVNHLQAHGYDVQQFADREKFMEAVHTRVFPIQLIDVSLRGHSDADGFELASACAKAHPEALRICISGKLDTIPPRTIVRALNARHDDSLQLSLPTSLGLRDIWAIYDKEDAYEGLRVLIEGYRELVGCGDEREIWVDDDLRKDFNEGFQSIRWDELGVVHEAQVQVVEIVRQLARRPGMPPVQKITLEKLGKGRSRTIVAQMRIEFEGPGSRHASKMTYKERQSIIKIGRLTSIQREMSNYTKFLPQIFGATFYPNVEATGVSRNLAGISYSCLSDQDRRVAPTLLDALHGVGGLSTDEALKSLDRAFTFKDSTAVELSSRLKGISLLRTYYDRFSDLRLSTPIPLGAADGQGTRTRTLWETLHAANERLLDHGIATRQPDGRVSFQVGKLSVWSAARFEDLTAQIRFEDYWSSIGHGDFHLDNILVIPQGSGQANFYIDFADAGPQHVMLDFVVMDAAARFQSIKFLAEIYRPNHEGPLLKALLSLEEALWLRNRDWSPPNREQLDPAVLRWLTRTWTIADRIRCNTWRFLNENLRVQIAQRIQEDVGRTSPKPSVDREVEAECQRFACGLGLASLSAMHLRQSDALQPLHQAWFALVSQLYLHSFNVWKEAGSSSQVVIPQANQAQG